MNKITRKIIDVGTIAALLLWLATFLIDPFWHLGGDVHDPPLFEGVTIVGESSETTYYIGQVNRDPIIGPKRYQMYLSTTNLEGKKVKFHNGEVKKIVSVPGFEENIKVRVITDIEIR